MFRETLLEVRREVEATLVPSGAKVCIKPHTMVSVTQALGNSYTLLVNGNMVRIAGIDGDAIGLAKLELPDINAAEGSVEDKVWEQLRTCFDPEIPVNVVDLGLIYECHLIPLRTNVFHVQIVMTLTAAGCGMGPILVSEIEEKLNLINEIEQCKVELVFDPPWDRNKMSDEAKLQLGLL